MKLWIYDIHLTLGKEPSLMSRGFNRQLFFEWKIGDQEWIWSPKMSGWMVQIHLCFAFLFCLTFTTLHTTVVWTGSESFVMECWMWDLQGREEDNLKPPDSIQLFRVLIDSLLLFESTLQSSLHVIVAKQSTQPSFPWLQCEFHKGT